MTLHGRVAVVAGVMTIVGSMDMTRSAVAMSLDFSWAGVGRCVSKPPAFTLSDVPARTRRLAFNMVDLDFPSFPHGGGTVAYRGGDSIAAGSFTYQGPCPPEGQRHTYRWTVKALDAAGKTLAVTSTTHFRRRDAIGGHAAKDERSRHAGPRSHSATVAGQT